MKIHSRLYTASGHAAVAAFLAMSVAVSAQEPPLVVEPYVPPLAPPARDCVLNLGQAQVDYGSHTAGELDAVERLSLTFGKRTVALNANCPFTSAMSLRLQGPIGQNGQLRFGKGGVTRVTLGSVTLDGNPVWLSNETDLQERSTEAVLIPGQRLLVVTPEGEARGRILSATLTVEPVVPTADTKVSAQADWRTDATIELLAR